MSILHILEFSLLFEGIYSCRMVNKCFEFLGFVLSNDQEPFKTPRRDS